MCTLCAFSIIAQFSKIQSCKLGCGSDSPAAHFLCSTAHIRQDISGTSFCSCKLLCRSYDCVLLHCSNAQPDIFAVMNGCVVALNACSSGFPIWSDGSLYSVQ